MRKSSNMMDQNAKYFVLLETEQSLDFMKDSTNLIWACTWEMAERPATTITTPAAIAETILNAIKNNNRAYNIIAKINRDKEK